MSDIDSRLIDFLLHDIETVTSDKGEISPYAQILVNGEWKEVSVDSEEFRKWMENDRK